MNNYPTPQQLEQLPEVMPITQLRYQTKKLQDLLVNQKKPIIITVRSKKIGFLTPLVEKPTKKWLPMPPAYHLGNIPPEKLRRVNLYRNYLKKKMNVNPR